MHKEARDYVARFATDAAIDVVEIGSRNINGTVRDLFPNARWYGIDLYEGPMVDEVADAATWQPAEPVDLVVSCEVFEHAESWRQIIANTRTMLRPGGRIVVTAAGPRRATHSGVDGGSQLHPGEYYGNVEPLSLLETLKAAGFTQVEVDDQRTDVRGTGTAPEEA